MKDPRRREDVQEPLRRNNWTIVSLIVGMIILAGAVVYVLRTANPDQDRLTNAQIAATTTAPSHEKLCSSSATFNVIKRTLFERAASLRGTDQNAFNRIADYAVVRMDNPVMESQDNATGAVNCSGSLSIDLPPGVAVTGDNRSLTSNVDYTVSAATDGTAPTVIVRNSDAIITQLATLAQASPAPGQSANVPLGNANEPETNAAAPGTQGGAPPPSTSPQPRAESPRTGVDCTAARSHADKAGCSDTGIAALDRQMISDYSRAFALASPDQRDLLRDTGRRFADYRDRCETRTCLQDAYSGRMKEIRDIMEDRWQAP